jgi:hypothetical protein
MTSSASPVGVDKYVMIHPKSGQTIIQNLCPELLWHFQKHLAELSHDAD